MCALVGKIKNLNSHGINDARESETCAAWRLMFEPCACEDGIVVKSLKINNSPGVVQISSLFNAVCGILC